MKARLKRILGEVGIVLLVLAFLFPPLWLHGMLVFGLLVGLGWSFR